MYFIDVNDLKVAEDGTVIVFFSDNSRFEYHTGTRLWREINPDIELLDKDNDAKKNPFTVITSTG